jgi:hypothetical protein
MRRSQEAYTTDARAPRHPGWQPFGVWFQLKELAEPEERRWDFQQWRTGVGGNRRATLLQAIPGLLLWLLVGCAGSSTDCLSRAGGVSPAVVRLAPGRFRATGNLSASTAVYSNSEPMPAAGGATDGSGAL